MPEKKGMVIGMKIKRVMIAAPGSGSGKTAVTCALLQTLKNNGYSVRAFKCGPDYIDPMFHEKVIDVPAKNLDTFFTDEETTRMLFLDSVREEDIAVLEGVMGLYDGVGGIREEGSSYHLAKVTKTPILLVVDAKGMGRSLVSLIAGFLEYDKEHLIQGVILNRISKGFYETVKPLIEEELQIQVTGFLPEKEEYHIESRHLGLIMPNELDDIQSRLRTISEEFSKTVSIENIIEIAKSAEEWKTIGKKVVKRRETDRVAVAAAKDEAFCFYYADNIRMLEENGADIKYFSPLWDEKLPEGCHALLIGGGYPELYAGELSRNSKMRAAVKSAVESGMPVVAECGGFLYLHSEIADRDGICHDMAGVIPASCFYTGKLVRFGYIELYEKQKQFLPDGERIKGHEFHYYDSTLNGTDVIAVKPVSGKKYSCIIENETQWMGFPHLYYPSNPMFAKAFIEKAKKYGKAKSFVICQLTNP